MVIVYYYLIFSFLLKFEKDNILYRLLILNIIISGSLSTNTLIVIINMEQPMEQPCIIYCGREGTKVIINTNDKQYLDVMSIIDKYREREFVLSSLAKNSIKIISDY